VGVVADRVPGLDDLLEPIDVLLLKDSAHGKAVQDAAMALHAPAGLDRVPLVFLVQIALLVVPVGFVPGWEITAHLEVAGDRDERLVGLRGALRLSMMDGYAASQACA